MKVTSTTSSSSSATAGGAAGVSINMKAEACRASANEMPATRSQLNLPLSDSELGSYCVMLAA